MITESAVAMGFMTDTRYAISRSWAKTTLMSRHGVRCASLVWLLTARRRSRGEHPHDEGADGDRDRDSDADAERSCPRKQ